MGDFILTLDPPQRVTYIGGKIGTEPVSTTIKLSNNSKERCAFKVKCTSNDLFRIRPPIGNLRPGDNQTITVTFNSGKSVPESGKHYVAFYYIKVNDEKKAARQFWSEHKGEPHGTKRLYVDFKKDDDEKKEEKKEGGEEKKEEEKKEEKKEEEKKEGGEEKKEEKKEEEKKEGAEGGEKKEEEKKEEKKEEEKKEAAPEEKKEEEKKEEKKEGGEEKKEEEKKE
uniref:Major sperm protein n=1 Tax=Panagrellus redivivus TaxID=6233 RepID=A0A7E4V3K3_PANRE